MRATTIYAAHDVRLEAQPDPTIQKPTDAIVKVVAACICGSDLWYYRGDNPIKDPFRIGHEFVGVVEQVGSHVRSLHTGDFVIAPFMYSDNSCPHCRVGIQSACSVGGFWGGRTATGCWSTAARVSTSASPWPTAPSWRLAKSPTRQWFPRCLPFRT
jgi:threonine dehydrogenase-like Zn-dependent dehydrogenase